MTKKNKPYLPNLRSWYEPSEESLISKSPEGIDTILPNPAEDPIVVNNISYMEFDYTNSSMLDDPDDELEYVILERRLL